MKVQINKVSIFQLTRNLRSLRTAKPNEIKYYRGKIITTTLPSKKMIYG